MRPSGRRRGFTYAEVVAAVTIFGVALAGLGATSLAQLRMARFLERRISVVVAQGSTLEVTGYDASADRYTYSYEVSSASDDVTGPADRWAARLGLATSASRDARKERLPVSVSPPLRLAFDPPVGAYTHARDVTLSGPVSDDGVTASTVVQVAEASP